jgi:MFS family permease
VWVTAFAAVIAFMGIGLVDPILKPRLAARLGESRAMLLGLTAFALLPVVDAFGSTAAVAAVTVLCGACLGLLNTLYTGAAMAVSDSPRPVASAGYNFLRWFGGAAGATLVGHIAHWAGNDQAPFLVAGALVAVGAGLLLLGHRTLGTLHVVPAMAPAMANAD